MTPVEQEVAAREMSKAIDGSSAPSIKEGKLRNSSGRPPPLSVEAYRKLANSKKYKEYLSERKRIRIAGSYETDPVDGGPTDEAILAEFFSDQKREGG
ncbi:MAG: hypothetical protein H6887_02465 [Hoeflea sp.]|nr:hypothetical protein [Hoeflea sp.]